MKHLPAILILLAIAVSCKKNQAGGSASITGTVSHHGRAVANARVFVKYAAKEFPGNDTTIYDADVNADNAGKYTFKCYKGDYFLFARAVENGTVVTGGVPAHVRSKEMVTADIAVSEDH
jgi:hypothetical protein